MGKISDKQEIYIHIYHDMSNILSCMSPTFSITRRRANEPDKKGIVYGATGRISCVESGRLILVSSVLDYYGRFKYL